MVKHLAQKDSKYNPRRDALIWFVDLYHQTEDDPVGWAFRIGDDESHPEQFGFKTAQEAFTALENWWVSIPEYHRPGYRHLDVYVEDAGGTGYVDTFDWDTDVVQDKKEARVNFGQGINFFDMGLNRATVQQMLKSMGPHGDFRITDDSVFFENPADVGKLKELLMTATKKIGQALSGKEIADAIKTNVDNYMNDKISYEEMGHVQRLLWDRAKEADVEDYVLDVVGPRLNRQKFERESALIAKIDAAESFLAEAKSNVAKFKRQAQEAQTEEALEYATSMTSEWAMTIEEAQNKLADANKALMELSKIFTEYDSYIEQSGVQKGAAMKNTADKVPDVALRKYQMAISGPATMLNTEEDMQWLRDVHLPNLSPNYKCAVIYGNEDWPDRIEVYEDENPTIEDAPLVFLPDENKNYEEMTGPKEASVKKRAGIGTEVEGVDEENNVINYIGDYGPGKFNDNVTEYIYDIVMNGFSNQSLGESEGFGSYDLVILDPPMQVNQEGGSQDGKVVPTQVQSAVNTKNPKVGIAITNDGRTVLYHSGEYDNKGTISGEVKDITDLHTQAFYLASQDYDDAAMDELGFSEEDVSKVAEAVAQFAKEGGGSDGQGSWTLGAAILHEDSQGFVDADYFDTADEALRVWAELEKEYEQYMEEVEEENPDGGY